MQQAITGVSPPEQSEVGIATVWPSIAVTALGRWLGRRFENNTVIGPLHLSIGRVWVLMSIPLALKLYFFNLLPFRCRRYRLTNRRVIIQKGLAGVDERWCLLGDFDEIQIVVQPGQSWYRCGDMVFTKGKVESLRLAAVPHPESFRSTCLKAQRSYTSVKKFAAK
ncbi:MAG: PH domain-containing protein [Planctomycetia bacterium]|nr:PH domain-containing protein [Planctomycetia bacterium]